MINSFILAPLIYLGGVFFSLENLHPMWETISQANPLLYFINGIRYAINGTSDVTVTSIYTVTITFGVLGYIFSLLGLCKGENYYR